MGLPIEELLKTRELSDKLGQANAARKLGISRAALRGRLTTLDRRGKVPQGNWTDKLPEGFMLDRVNLNVGEDGKVRQQWMRGSKEAQSVEAMVEILHDALDRHAGEVPLISKPCLPLDAADFLTVYPLADLHLGMYAWAKETGKDYDCDIAWGLLEATMTDLVQASPPSEEGLVLNLGDFFHADNDLARTRSGNPLDMDTRFGRVLMMGVELTHLTVMLSLQKHDHVTYRALPGNHDPYAALALAIAMHMAFKGNPRVTVDIDPSYFYMLQWGKTMLMGTHGDMLKPNEIAGFMAAKWPKVWGETVFRYAYLGHIHHSSKGGEKCGAIWETFQTLAPKDGWHSQMGFMSNRSMSAIALHKKSGERFRTIRAVDYE